LAGARASTARSAAAGWVARADTAALLYGAILSAAVMASISLESDDATRVALSTTSVLFVYWLADVYVHAISMRFDRSEHHLGTRVVAAARHEVGILEGGLPSIAIYLLAYVLVRDSSDAAFAALWFSVVMLMVVGYVGAHRGGASGRAAIIEALGAGLFGMVIIGAKTLLH
jgi:hypothetical protein